MVSSGASNLLIEKQIPGRAPARGVEADLFRRSSSVAFAQKSAIDFLRIPPFPGARTLPFAHETIGPSLEGQRVAEALRRERVGGSYWAAQPDLPTSEFVLVRSRAGLEFARSMSGGAPILLWEAAPGCPVCEDAAVVVGECDPWHMLSRANALIVERGDDLQLIAALLDVPCHIFDASPGVAETDERNAGQLAGDLLSGLAFEDPFSGAPINVIEAIELCGFWRRLIDSNRRIGGGLGFAFWKQSHVGTLLWGGSEPFRFLRTAAVANHSAPIALWRAKAASPCLAELDRKGIEQIEVEDGFLRSRGLGADCIPPLSITVDRLGPHFDPAQPSELEQLLQNGEFDSALLERARELRRFIVESGIGKYERGTAILARPGGSRRHILVPGQVEDDRAVQAGGCGLVSNLELLARVRAKAPDAYIIYKPHPDVVAGHRRGAVSDADCLKFADEIVGDLAVASLIAMVDEVHVNTSLTGFEALLREKCVTTHGVPFYAGWGLTTDLGPVPARRSARRSLDELVAATLLLYPRYLDPVTGLPCPAEVVVARLAGSEQSSAGFIVGMRRLQGKLMRRLRSLVQ